MYIAHAPIIINRRMLFCPQKTCSQDLHTFYLIGIIALHCGHTLLGGIVSIMPMATHKTPERLLTKKETKWQLPPRGQYDTHARFLLSSRRTFSFPFQGVGSA